DTDKRAVIEMLDADTLYHVPIALQEQGLDKLACEHLHLNCAEADMVEWEKLVNKVRNLTHTLTIGLVGKYVELPDAYLSIVEALKHAGFTYDTDVKIRWINSQELDEDTIENKLADVDGIIVPGGFGTRGIEGKISAIKYAREKKIHFLGVCLGMQLAAVEIARNVEGLTDAHSVEVNKDTKNPIVTLLSDQEKSEQFGGTLKLGSYTSTLVDGTKTKAAYNDANSVSERHRHRYGINLEYEGKLKDAGFIASAYGEDGTTIQAMELVDHPWFIGCQYHPEFKSRPTNPYPLIESF